MWLSPPQPLRLRDEASRARRRGGGGALPLKPPASPPLRFRFWFERTCALSLRHDRGGREIRFEGDVESRLLLGMLTLRFLPEGVGEACGSARRPSRTLASAPLRHSLSHAVPRLAWLAWPRLRLLTLPSWCVTFRFPACAPSSFDPCHCWLPMTGHLLFAEEEVKELSPLSEYKSDEEE